MMIAIERYNPQMRHEWDSHVKASKNGTFLLLRDYMDYHSDRFTDCSLVATDAETHRIVALLPASLSGDCLTSHGGLTYGGWIMPLKQFNAATMLQVMDAALEFLREMGVKTLIYKPIPHIYHTYPAEEDLYALFRVGAQPVVTNVSTTIPLDSALPFNTGAKSSVSKASQSGVTLHIAQTDALAEYWEVLQGCLQERHSASPVHSLSEITSLAKAFPENIVLSVARHPQSGRILAGVLEYRTATVAHAQYTATTAEGRQMRALPLLYKALIERAQADGRRYYDFGTSNEEQGRTLNASLLEQKTGMGGRAIVYNTFKIEI